MGLFDRLKPTPKPTPRDPRDREKSAGSREHEAQRHDRRASRLDQLGDDAGAQAERDLAAELRRPVPRR